MTAVIAFDVYGTLINTHGVVTGLSKIIGDKAQAFSQTWRDKQLEYSFRRGLMQNYVTFAECTLQAFDYACAVHKTSMTHAEAAVILDSYKSLPAFTDAIDGLQLLHDAGHRLYAFSNGAADAVETVLENAGIRSMFLGVVSVDDIKSFKPNPAVYAHMLRQTNAKASDAWLVSSNPFDVTGAISAGLRAAWVQRAPTAIFDPWEIQPTEVIHTIGELGSKL